MLDLSTGEVAVLADAGAFATAWFPDGRNLIYTAASGRLHVVSADGTVDRELTAAAPGQVDHAEAVAPDGTRVLFDRSTEEGEGQYRIEVLAVDVFSTVETPIATSAPQSRAVGWSPDGSRVAFLEEISFEDTPLLTALPDGSERRRLVTGHISDAAWAPDGRSLAGVRYNEFLDTDVLVVDAVTAAERILVDGGGGEGGYGGLSWAADGSRIVFTASGEGFSSMYTVAATGGDTEAITTEEDTNGVSPASAPAGVLRLSAFFSSGTAASVSRFAFPTADTVLVARDDDYADGLAAAPLAAALGAPCCSPRATSLPSLQPPRSPG